MASALCCFVSSCFLCSAAKKREDSGSTGFTAKKMTVVHPEQQPKVYRSVISHVEIPLPENPMRYTAMPNANPKEGIWGAAGVNSANVSMTATERSIRPA